MAGTNDDVLLGLKVVSQGVEEIARAQAQIVQLQQKAVQLQRDQAAAATAQAASLNTLSKSFSTAEVNVGQLTNQVGEFTHGLGAIPGVMELARLALDAGRRAVGGFQDVLKAGADMEAWEASFGVLLGGTDRAKKHLADLADFAAHTPFELPQVIEASKLLESLNLTTGKYLTTLGNVASFLNRPLTDAVLAVGNAQRGEFENLKTFGVDISVIMQRAGVSLNSSAKRTVEDNHKIVDELIKYWDEKFGGGMEKIAATTGGKLSNISDAWFQFKVKIAQSGVGDVFRDELGKILEKIDQLEKDGTLERWAKAVSGAMESVFHAAEATAPVLETLFSNLDKLRIPIGILVGSVGFLKLAGVLTLAGGALGEFAIAAGAATGAVDLLEFSIASLGGPIVVGIALIGGLVGAMVFDNAKGQVDALKNKYAELDEELLKASKRAPAAAPDFASALEQADLATSAVKRLRAERDALDQVSPIALIDQSQLLALDEATAKMRGLADEAERARRGGIDREAPIAAPVAAVREARAQLGETYGFRPGDTFDTLRARGQAAAAPVATVPGKPTVTPPDEKAIAAAKKAFEEQVKLAGEMVRLEQDTAGKLADAVASGVKRRIETEAQGAAERLQLIEAFEHDDLAKFRALAEEKLRAESDIEQRRQGALAAIRSSTDDPRVRARLEAEVERRASNERAALDRTVADGTFLAAFDKKIGAERAAYAQQSADDRAAAERKAAEEIQAQVLELVKFEQSIRKASADELVQDYARRLIAVRKGSDEEIALSAKLAAALKLAADEAKALNLELEKYAALGIATARALELKGKGITPEDVTKAGEASGTEGDAAARVAEAIKANKDLDDLLQHAQDVTGQIRDTFTLLFHDLGAGWDLAAIAGKVAMDGFAAAGTAAYNTLQKAAQNWFQFHRGTHALALQIVKAAAKEGAAASLDAIAQVTKAEALEAEGLALKALAQGILGDPRGFLAAAKYQLAAFALGGISAIASGGAAAIRASAQEDAQAATAGGDSTRAVGAGDTTSRLKSVGGNAPITQNFNVSVNFYGGLNLFGPDAAIALLREMKPYLQQMLNDRELTVPTGNA